MRRGLKTRSAGCENGFKSRRVKSDASSKKLSVKDTVLIFLYPAFAAKGCVYYEKPDTVLLQRKADVYYSRNPPCNAKDNLRTEYIIIEDWLRGYCGSPALGGPRASGLLMWARLIGR